MQYEAYRDLIQRLEAEAAHDPDGFTLRVGCFGLLGYGYIVLVFAVFAALAIGLMRLSRGGGAFLALKLGIVVVPLGLALVRPLLQRFSSPRGVPLTRERVPMLFATIDEIAGTLKAPRPHRVLLTHDYNCSILQRPRLGILGWPENVLMLGLPMLETLSRSRFRAILAHELGHLAAHHSTLAGRLHVVSDAWGQLLNRLSSRPNVLFRALEVFFRWYGPRFQAMGFVLGRRQEYFADRCASRVAGMRATCGSLVRIDVMARHCRETMGQMVHQRMREEPEPAADLFATMARRMREDPSPEQLAVWIDEELRADTGYEHTHPALRDRITALDHARAITVADGQAEAGPTAAQDQLGAELEVLTDEVGALWMAEVAPSWRSRHEELAELARTAQGTEVEEAQQSNVAGVAESHPRDEPDRAWTALAAQIEVDGHQDPTERLAAFVATEPQHALARLRLGHALLERGDDTGLAHLQRATSLDTDLTRASCRIAIDFLRAQGRGGPADDWTRRAWEFEDLARRADDERRLLRKQARLVAHDLPESATARLARRLAGEPWIAEAYLARREVALRPEKPCYVLGLVVHRPWYKYADPQKEAAAAWAMISDDAIPVGTWTFQLDGNLRWARKRMARLEAGQIWSRHWAKTGPDGRAKAA